MTMHSPTRRRITLGALAGGVVMVLTASLAWACTGLASLSSSASSTSPGQRMEIAGQGYAKNGGSVSVRFDSGWGDVLATARPDRNGKFRASVAVPDMTPGDHVLLAIQSDAAGKSIVATGSLPLDVVAGPSAATVSPVPAASSSATPGSANRATAPGTAPWALAASLGLGAVVLLAAGAAASLVQARTIVASRRLTRPVADF
ncbi:MAG: hypothetical protein ACRD0Q_08170 [Acidimicrobiales bacterium]